MKKLLTLLIASLSLAIVATLAPAPLGTTQAQAASYTIGFNLNGGSGTPPSSVSSTGAPVYLPTQSSQFSRTGYTFGGWNSNSAGTGTHYTAGCYCSFNASATLYAEWSLITPTKYTLTFNSNGGSAVASITATSGATVALAGTPTRSGYKFKGWKLGATIYPASSPYGVYSNQTFIAQWEANSPYSLYGAIGSYINSHMSSTGGPASNEYDWAWGRAQQVKNGGYVVWSQDTENTGAHRLSGAIGDYIVKNISSTGFPTSDEYDWAGGRAQQVKNGLYVVWSKSTESAGAHRLYGALGNYILNNVGATGFPTTDEYTVPGGVEIKTKNTRLYWDGTTGAIITNARTLTYISNGVEIGSRRAALGSTVALAGTPTRAGYTFDGWGAEKRAASSPYSVSGDVTFVAQWKASTYALTFSTGGGTAVQSMTNLKYADKVILPPAPSRAGNSFQGWQLGSSVYSAGSAYTVYGSQAFSAKWGYEISFGLNGGSGAVNKVSGPMGGPTYLPTGAGLSRTGHTFTGWNTSAAGTGTSYTAGCYCTFSASATLYAQWKPNTYTLTFNSNGGSAVGPVTGVYGATVALAGKPTRAGHTFLGWLSGSNSYSASSPYTVSGDKTFTAQWNVNTVSVSFNLNNGSGTIPLPLAVIGTNQVTMPPQGNITREGYVFTGWNSNSAGTGASYTAGSVPYSFSANTVLFAKWVPAYKISFNLNGGSGKADSVSAAVNSPVYLPTAAGLSLAGYTFGGWNTNAAGTGTTYAAGCYCTFSASATLYAKWNGVAATSITVSPTSLVLAPGAVREVMAKILPANASEKKVNWTSTDDNIVTVVNKVGTSGNANIAVAGNKTGTATLTAKTADGKFSAYIAVRVAAISVSPTPVAVRVGTTLKLTGSAQPADGVDTLFSWKSSNAKIVEIANATGTTFSDTVLSSPSIVVRGVASGSATITVQSKYVSTVIKVTVYMKKYVALGDSYSTGIGIATSASGTEYSYHPWRWNFDSSEKLSVPDSLPTDNCYRTTQGYPRLITASDASIGLADADFVACQGDMMADIAGKSIITNDARKRGHESNPAQINRLTSDTDLVTLTIGGNDIGFGKVGEACVLGGKGGCKTQIDAAKAIVVNASFVGDLKLVYREILKKAPNAKVYVLGYPNPVRSDSSRTCLWSPIDGVFTVDGIYDLVEGLNGAIGKAVREIADKRLVYVDVNSADSQFSAHTLCSKDPWLNRVDWFTAANATLFSKDETAKLPFAHPNLKGNQEYARLAKEAIAKG